MSTTQGNKILSISVVTVLALLFSAGVPAQISSGGSFSLLQSVTGNGGGVTANGPFNVGGIAGQPVAGGNLTGPPFALQSGFWNPLLVPTAAGVSIGGRVTTSDGRGIRNAAVVITDSRGHQRTVFTGQFGYYVFEDVTAGASLVVTINSRHYHFSPQVVQLTDSLANVDFVSLD